MVTLIEDALFNYLIGLDPIKALVGTRIYPDFAPENADLPLVIYRLESDIPDMTLSGPSGLIEAQCVFEIWAAVGNLPSVLGAIAQALLTALNGYNGSMGDLDLVQIICTDAAPRARDPETIATRRDLRFKIFYHTA